MKKVKIVGVWGIFIISILLHFIYELLPNNFISIIAPVNESIWEHMKLILSSSIIFGIIEYVIYKKKNINFNNFILSYALASIISIITYLILYVPINDIFGHKIYIAVGLLFLIFIFLQVISYYIMNYKKIKYGNILGIMLIIGTYILFWYFTYNPPKINLFYDTLNKSYGIKK